ncbi:hypothetical protein FRACYDRAFT_264890 [Fragilariopsis cylindrus CCMP1102]|uniref:Uncharacterized protein n=1 Tax=Fragilariopsis cylindrus CCMP1102 TaxID=635003 RepID=A0A1E7ENM2_9STRA|nr:hypothetical protein FRACYDRAFT_264890 [Fragilariopsis cylindrus CCMP1102]|eukprot:OEU07550.1 hypothetical protein FRACYDRAFT_264890 [Fragilariopsis cylindrus CCMP1102]
MMYSLRSSSTLLVAVTVVAVFSSSGDVYAFSPPKMIIMRQNKQISATQIATSALFVSPTTTRSSQPVAEEDARYIFNKAREFAFKDEQRDDYDSHYHSLSDEENEIKEAKFYLNEIVHLQSGCVVGTLVDPNQDGMCDVDSGSIVAEMVTKLSNKVKRHESRLSNYNKYSSSSTESSGIPWIATGFSVSALVLVFAAFAITLDIDSGPIQTYQHFIDILHNKGYFVSLINQLDPLSQHIMSIMYS